MDFINKIAHSSADKGSARPNNVVATEQDTKKLDAGGGGIMGSLNNMMGGGAKGEANEDALDKAVDWVQEHVLHQGPQDNESAVEQAKDKAIAESIRAQWKKTTGFDFPVKDKKHGQERKA
ncbi:hypothetical protein DFH11DRAFT_808622 [Phellopilus nigrolimitatus]|nr:hypothetical protein DFH11DRAFT_808622 [Phellopilus nigrolimitatus]